MRGQITLEKIRPDGFAYPVGLNATGTYSGTVDYLVVAGGGGGDNTLGGGGGAGGFQTASGFPVLAGTPYTVTVGGGGNPGYRGSNSVFHTVSSVGGGCGTRIETSGGFRNGGSGGGAYYTNPIGLGTPGQGNNGGSGSPSETSGGGGGAGAVGSNAAHPVGGNGGAGTASPYSGSPVTYAGGGGGGAFSGTGGTGGSGGGGNAGPSGNSAGSAGTPNTGGGGGGASYTSPGGQSGGAGGKGIVIVRYSGSQLATGGTVTTSPGYTIHTFTGDGTFATNSTFGSTSYSIN